MEKNGKNRALLLVDFINLFDFPESEKLAARAVAAARKAAALKQRAAAAGVPCIYANDNFGHWKSEFSRLVRECQAREGASGEIARILPPSPEDYSVLKPRHSAFYGSPLDFLLEELEVDSLVITGLSTDICVFATAQDAYVRKYRVWIPADCAAADTEEHERQALEHMERTLKARISPSETIAFP
ncbi:MAG TPA: isochorismatase family cysteine hydrolase [Usitatibacter sp.]|nr:isochorismatase family cysteine hydrolase [Usitatibacter sp.]